LPREDYLLTGLRLYVLPNVLLQLRITHPRMIVVFQQVSLVQIKTVIAIDIAFSARGLIHRMKAIVSTCW
jgi:hypothetical protein